MQNNPNYYFNLTTNYPETSITSRETKKTNDTDSSLLYNSSSSSFDNDNLSPVILDSLIYPSNNLTVNETQINIEKAQMFINKVLINEQNEISPLKIILNEDNRKKFGYCRRKSGYGIKINAKIAKKTKFHLNF